MKHLKLAVFVLACFLVPYLLGGFAYYSGIAVYAVALALFGLSVNLSVGYLGYVSFGHAAFFGLGAYTAALLTLNAGLNFWLALCLAPIPGAFLGALVGFASLRVGGSYFAIATLTVAEILYLLAGNLMNITRGPLGLIVPRPKIKFFDALGMSFHQYYLAIAMLILLVVFICLGRLLKSPVGRAWAVIKESPHLGESIGIPTLRYRVINITISGALAGLAGALFVPRTLVVVPELFGSGLSATGLLIAILGGKGTLVGPLLGGLTFAALPELLRFVDDYRMAIFAFILLVIVRLKPSGLASFVPKTWRTHERSPAYRETSPKRFEPSGDLVVTSLSKNFGGLAALKNVALKVGTGEVVGVIGPNGAGKTTCLSLVSGFVKPSGGTVTFSGEDLKGLAPHKLASRGLVRTFQQTAVCADMSCFFNVLSAVPGDEGLVSSIIQSKQYLQREEQRRQAALGCLALVGLLDEADVVAGSMPYGKQKLLSVALALAACPRLLMLDEPAAGLNHTEARTLSELLLRLRDAGLTIVLVDHNLKMMMAICDRIYVLNGGQPLADGTPVEVRNNPEVIQAYLGSSKHRDVEHA